MVFVDVINAKDKHVASCVVSRCCRVQWPTRRMKMKIAHQEIKRGNRETPCVIKHGRSDALSGQKIKSSSGRETFNELWENNQQMVATELQHWGNTRYAKICTDYGDLGQDVVNEVMIQLCMEMKIKTEEVVRKFEKVMTTAARTYLSGKLQAEMLAEIKENHDCWVQHFWQSALRQMKDELAGEECQGYSPQSLPRSDSKCWTHQHARLLTKRGFVILEGLIPSAGHTLAGACSTLYRKKSKASVNPCNIGAFMSHIPFSKEQGFEGFPAGQAQDALWQFVGLAAEVLDAGYPEPFVVPNHLILGCYPPGQAHYTRHLDNTPAEERNYRELTFLLYTNVDWNDSLGGHLQIYTDKGAAIKVRPSAGTVVVFQSRRIFHEVHSAKKERYALTLWPEANPAQPCYGPQ
eukprot:gnl/MRDRNA2_/MRDRNA2_106786_c0_seq1.p1 gnl/MRDRNA2_/MRDRNA2_106786_c0~~gnl/MRDRNA2_/MRDRNA2_106786_c0_seq1.p1  ORF type:complete len:407 (+),score=58.87 gnl/MRDRNA2_/MRDRNA2_106786_c0_seq1:79-1299(+)